jgi:hypothetical protein
LTFDLSRRKSFDDCGGWLGEFQKVNTITNWLVVNKCDLEPDVTEKEARD